MVVGVVGTRIVVRRIAAAMISDPQLARDVINKRIELQLARRLQLGPGQRMRVREILDEMQGQLKLINQETQPRRASVITNAEAEIDLILSPDQKLQWERLKDEYPGLLRPNQFPQPFRQQQQP